MEALRRLFAHPVGDPLVQHASRTQIDSVRKQIHTQGARREMVRCIARCANLKVHLFVTTHLPVICFF